MLRQVYLGKSPPSYLTVPVGTKGKPLGVWARPASTVLREGRRRADQLSATLLDLGKGGSLGYGTQGMADRGCLLLAQRTLASLGR